MLDQWDFFKEKIKYLKCKKIRNFPNPMMQRISFRTYIFVMFWHFVISFSYADNAQQLQKQGILKIW